MKPAGKTPPPGDETFGPEELTVRQAQALSALLSRPTLQAVAHAAKVGERTLRRWLSEDAGFKTICREARSESMRQATAPLQAATATQPVAAEAVDTLRELISLKERSDVRARAALGMWAAVSRAEELENLAAPH
jgi:hypothetical protein